MSLSQADVEKIASLARLELTAGEKALYKQQLSAVLDYVDRLSRLDVGEVPPTASAVALHNVMREDVPEPCLPLEDVLFNAAEKTQDQFRIQAVLDEG